MGYLGTIFIASSLVLAHKIVNKCNLQSYFISVPYIATIVLFSFVLLFQAIFKLELVFPQIISSFAVSIFLFSIGIQLYLHMNKRYIKRLLIFLFLCLILITIFEAFSKIFPDEVYWIVDSTMFAYNQDYINVIISSELHSTIFYWSSVQMLLVFYFTPVFAAISQNLFKDKSDSPKIVNPSKQNRPSLLFNYHIFSLLFLLASIVFILSFFPWLDRFFLYDFVFSMSFGFLYAHLQSKNHLTKHKKNTEVIMNIGTLGLYYFITVSILQSLKLYGWLFDWDIFMLIIIKTLFIALISFIFVKIFFKKWSFIDKNVAAIAGWTFMLNAPVVCMHGMRTVTNKFGPSPNVILLIPPVILWLVNYVHLLAVLILQQ